MGYVLPQLKAKNPSHKMKTPVAQNRTEWPGMGAPPSSNRPMRGPVMIAAIRAAVPPQR